jgi:hypothetical protein
MDDAVKGIILFLILARNALIQKKNMPLVMLVNWYPQTGISRQPLQLLLR